MSKQVRVYNMSSQLVTDAVCATLNATDSCIAYSMVNSK